MPSAERSPERASDPLELELQTAVGHHVGARNLTKFFWKSKLVLLTTKSSLQSQAHIINA